jgi:gamma-glutamyltranspeptidase/glutathione hydrolase
MTNRLRTLALFTLIGAFAVAPVAAQTPTTAAAKQPVSAQRGMVVSASTIASEIGNRVLLAGGNAIDAAIATGFALEVTFPFAGNIGGGGFMVIRFPDGRATTIDFREKAPLKAHAKLFLDSTGKYSNTIHHNSHIAVGVPGTVAGFALAHQKYGKAKWGALVDPSVKLARDGFAVPPGLARSLAAACASSSAIRPRYRRTRRTARPTPRRDHEAARSRQHAGAHQQQGRDGFYKGQTARLLADEMKRGGGLITEEDLARYEAKERAPMRGTYRGYDIISMAPPSSGGVAMIEMLNILEGFDPESAGSHSDAAPALPNGSDAARLPRSREVPGEILISRRCRFERLTNKQYAAELRKRSIRTRRARRPRRTSQWPVKAPKRRTTRLSMRAGWRCQVTYTLEAGYGTGIVVPGAGFFLNNEMGDFNAQPGLTDENGLIRHRAPTLPARSSACCPSMTPDDRR